MSLVSVLLPEPEGPTTPTIWPGAILKIHVVQDFGTIEPVAEGDVFENHLAADRRQCGACVIEGRFGRRIENIAKPRHRQARLVEVLPDLRQPQHRRADAAGQDIEGDKLANGQIAVDDELWRRNKARPR